MRLKEFELVRQWLTPKSTIGKLSLQGVYLMYTLEDTVRELKIPGETAIPYGRYRVALSQSQRFGRELPILLSVPNFTGVRIHGGNGPQDTEGCILVGFDKGNNLIGGSQRALEALLPMIRQPIAAGEEVYLSIVHGVLEPPIVPKSDGFVA